MPTIRPLRAGALLCALFAAPALVAPLVAQRPDAPPPVGAHPGAHRGDPGARLLRGITLTPDQQRQVEAWRAARAAERDSLVAAMRAQRQGSAPRVRPDSATMAARRDEARARMQANTQALRAILTPDQQATFDANARELATRATERMGRGGRWGRRGGGQPPR